MRDHMNGKGDDEILGLRAEMQLLQELQFSPEDRWLRLLYECKANKVGGVDPQDTRRTPHSLPSVSSLAGLRAMTDEAIEITPIG